MGGILFSTSLDIRLAAAMFAAILIFTLIWEELTQMLEEYLANDIHFLQMISKVYREMMILGFISLAVVLSNEFHLIKDHNALIHFEFAHLLAFLWALVYVTNSLVSTYRLRMTRKEWDVISHLTTEEICERAENEMSSGILGDVASTKLLRPDKLTMQILSSSNEQSKSWRPFWLSVLPFSNPTWQNLEWKILQRLFQRDFKLPQDFDYTKYLRLKLLEAMGHQLHVSVLTWGIVLGLTIFYIVLAYGYAAVVGENDACVSGSGNSSIAGITSDVEDDWNPEAEPEAGRRILGGMTGCENRRQLGGGKELSPASAMAQQIFQLVMAWLLVGGQMFVIYFTKDAIHSVLKRQTPPLEHPSAAPLFLRKIEAQLNVRRLLRSIPLFQGKGEEFFSDLSRHLDVEFIDANQTYFKEGDPGDSMVFIIQGSMEIVDESSSTVIGVLGAGDFAGEMSMLLGETRPKTIRAAGQDVELCVLREKQLSAMESVHGFAIEELREQALQRKSDHGQKLEDAETRSPKTMAKSSGSHGGGHSHGEKHPIADEIMSQKAKGRFTIFSELTLLLNCFQCSYYMMHVMWVVVPGTGAPIGMQVLLHFLFVFPAALVMTFLSPMAAKYQCILTTALYRDDEIIAEIHHEQERVVELRNRIRSTLMKATLLAKHDENHTITTKDVADHVFKVLDGSGDGLIETKELKKGLPEFGVFLTNKEIRQVIRTIDPDQSGNLEYNEWLNFMQASDKDLESDDWKDALDALKLRKKVRDALLAPAMKNYYELAGPKASPPDITDIVQKIFESLDNDGDGNLDFEELQGGLLDYGVDVCEDEFIKLVQLVDHGSSGSEITCDKFQEFMQVSDAKLKKIDAPASTFSKNAEIQRPASIDNDVFEREGDEYDNPLKANGSANGASTPTFDVETGEYALDGDVT